MIRILIADDHPIFRGGLAYVLSEAGDFAICAETASADETVTQALTLRPDLILLDLSMPGGGGQALSRILAQWPEAVIAILTASEDPAGVVEAMRAGARGYLVKGLGSAELIDALHRIHAGDGYVAPSIAARILSDTGATAPVPGTAHIPLLAQLTAREAGVLEWLASGYSNKEIARLGNMQEKTVKHHVSRILQKLQVRNRTEAALIRRAADQS